MARLLLSRRAVSDVESDPAAAAKTLDLLMSALGMLREHPLIGRPAEAGLRELVISRGRTGYVALYGYDEPADRVVVYATRHQREAGYAR